MAKQVKKKQKQQDENIGTLMLRLQMAKQVKKKEQQDRNMEASMLSLLLMVCTAEGARLTVDHSQLLLVNTTTLQVIVGIIDMVTFRRPSPFK